MRAWRWLLAAVLLLPAGCGGLLPKPLPPPALYRLTALPPAAGAVAPLPLQLLVDVPSAPAALDTERIALSRGPNSIDYFANAAWTDRAPLLIQSLLVESLENAGRIRGVARQSAELRADALLMADLRRFEAVYAGKDAPEVHVELECRLVRMPERTILAEKLFDGSAPAAENETPAIVAAFDTAWHQVMGDIATWTAASLAQMPARQ